MTRILKGKSEKCNLKAFIREIIYFTFLVALPLGITFYIMIVCRNRLRESVGGFSSIIKTW